MPLTGLLTSMPVLAFATFGALAPRLSRAIGIHRVTLGGLLCVVLGLGGRVLADSATAFLLLTMLALAGMATANVLLPSLVKLHFPDRVGTVTALYTTALAVGLTAALVLTVPVSEAFGGWRTGLGVWAVLAVLAALPWLALVAHDRRPAESGGAVTLGARRPHPARPGHGPRLRAPVAAGVCHLRLVRPALARRRLLPRCRRGPRRPRGGDQHPVLPLAPCCRRPPREPGRHVRRGLRLLLVGYAGLLVAPYTLAIPCAILIGVGTCTFALVLTLIGLRARTPEGTAALSGFSQSSGYLLAALGPFAVGALHDATGSWTAPLLLLLALTVPLMSLAVRVARPAAIEDELRRPLTP